MTPVGFESCLDKDIILLYKLVMLDEGIHHLRWFQLLYPPLIHVETHESYSSASNMCTAVRVP